MKVRRLTATLMVAATIVFSACSAAASPSLSTAPAPAATAAASSAATQGPAGSASTSLSLLADKAKAEGGTIYTYGMPDTWANYGGIFAAFQKTYGIAESDIDMGSSVVVSRMTAENASKNDLADLGPAFAQQLAAAGLTDSYQVSCWDSLPQGQKGVATNGSVWNTAYTGTIGWIVNTNLVHKVPKTWADLADPSLKGMISYLDPRATGTGINTVEAASVAASGDPFNYQAGVKLLANLKQIGNIATVDSKVDVSKYQRGEVGVLINFDYNLLQWKKTLGVPSEVVIPTDGTVATGGAVIAAKNAPHPNTARLALEFILCGPGQGLYAAAFVHPILPSVQLPPTIASQFPPASEYAKVVLIDYAKEAAVKQALISAWAAAAGS
jgi:putative spermidine/putrescine transport system substrate-binding protein